MPNARDMRAKAQQYLDLADRNGAWEAWALKALAAECISDAQQLEDGETTQTRPLVAAARLKADGRLVRPLAEVEKSKYRVYGTPCRANRR